MSEIKDANDLLKAWEAQGLTKDEQVARIRAIMDAATPIVVRMAAWAGALKGAKADAGVSVLMKSVRRMDKLMVSNYRMQLSEGLGRGLREFTALLKAELGEKPVKEGEGPEEIIETLGGFFAESGQQPAGSEQKERTGDAAGNGLNDGENGKRPVKRGWLIEYLWDEDSGNSALAYRDPDGKVGVAQFLDIDGKRYVPKEVNMLLRNKGVLFPSGLGELKGTKELVGIVERFIHRYYLLDDVHFGRMAAYYVLLTWLFDCFNALPYLRATGDYGSGKSELMRRVGHICYRLMITGGAGTAASLFRALEEYRGTAFMDEMDLESGGDMTDDLIKILNMGAMAGNPVWRLSEVMGTGGMRVYDVTAYNVFGPKLIAMRKDFKDQAVSSRCLTVKLMAKDPLELKARGVPLHLDEVFYRAAVEIRNLLVRWRLDKWRPEIRLSEDLMDLEVPARLNQVTMPLKAVAKDDPELMADITAFVRGLNEELVLERSMGIDARVLDALVTIREDAQYKAFLFEGEITGLGTCQYAFTKHISKVVNELMDDMNLAEEDEGEEEGKEGKEKKRKPRGTTSQTVGKIARQILQLRSVRKNSGYVVIYDEVKMEVLKKRYGVSGTHSETPPQHATKTGEGAKKGYQGSLLGEREG